MMRHALRVIGFQQIILLSVVFQVESTFPKERIHALTGCYFLDLDMVVLPASLLVKRINQLHRLLSAKRNKNFSSKVLFVSDKKAADGKERQLSRNESVFTPIGCLCCTLVHIVQETKVNNQFMRLRAYVEILSTREVWRARKRHKNSGLPYAQLQHELIVL